MTKILWLLIVVSGGNSSNVEVIHSFNDQYNCKIANDQFKQEIDGKFLYRVFVSFCLAVQSKND